jgi:hypothetical protein
MDVMSHYFRRASPQRRALGKAEIEEGSINGIKQVGGSTQRQ